MTAAPRVLTGKPTTTPLDVSAHRNYFEYGVAQIHVVHTPGGSPCTVRVRVRRHQSAENSHAVAEVLTPGRTWTQLRDDRGGARIAARVPQQQYRRRTALHHGDTRLALDRSGGRTPSHRGMSLPLAHAGGPPDFEG